MDNFETVDDINALWRALTPEEATRAEQLIPVVCDSLRMEAAKVGKDLDKMLDDKEYMKNVAKSVVVDVVARTLMTSTNSEPMTQMSQSGLGYSVSGTDLVPGGGLFIKNSELARLGLKRQRYGVMDFYAEGDNNQTDQ